MMKVDSLENPRFVDGWSLQHLSAGVFFGSLGWFTVAQYTGLHAIFEIWENTVGIVSWRDLGWKSYRGDSWLNIMGDIVCGTAGFAISDAIFKGKRASYPLLAAVSIVCGLIAYNHPEPADESFFADKVSKGVATFGVLGVCAGLYYGLKGR